MGLSGGKRVFSGAFDPFADDECCFGGIQQWAAYDVHTLRGRRDDGRDG